MRNANRLPDFSVIVWIRIADEFDALRSELLSIADDEPYEASQYQGMADFHWGFDEIADARALAEAFTKIPAPPIATIARFPVFPRSCANPPNKPTAWRHSVQTTTTGGGGRRGRRRLPGGKPISTNRKTATRSGFQRRRPPVRAGSRHPPAAQGRVVRTPPRRPWEVVAHRGPPSETSRQGRTQLVRCSQTGHPRRCGCGRWP
jgi:hypothetical protein